MATTKRKQAWALGPELQRHRKAAGLSQREASKAAGFSVTTWSALESGEKKLGDGLVQNYRPRPAVVEAAAKVVGMDVAEAMKKAGLDPSKHMSDQPPAPTVSQRQLIDLFARLDNRQRSALLELVESMLTTSSSDVH